MRKNLSTTFSALNEITSTSLDPSPSLGTALLSGDDHSRLSVESILSRLASTSSSSWASPSASPAPPSSVSPSASSPPFASATPAGWGVGVSVDGIIHPSTPRAPLSSAAALPRAASLHHHLDVDNAPTLRLPAGRPLPTAATAQASMMQWTAPAPAEAPAGGLYPYHHPPLPQPPQHLNQHQHHDEHCHPPQKQQQIVMVHPTMQQQMPSHYYHLPLLTSSSSAIRDDPAAAASAAAAAGYHLHPHPHHQQQPTATVSASMSSSSSSMPISMPMPMPQHQQEQHQPQQQQQEQECSYVPFFFSWPPSSEDAFDAPFSSFSSSSRSSLSFPFSPVDSLSSPLMETAGFVFAGTDSSGVFSNLHSLPDLHEGDPDQAQGSPTVATRMEKRRRLNGDGNGVIAHRDVQQEGLHQREMGSDVQSVADPDWCGSMGSPNSASDRLPWPLTTTTTTLTPASASSIVLADGFSSSSSSSGVPSPSFPLASSYLSSPPFSYDSASESSPASKSSFSSSPAPFLATSRRTRSRGSR